MSGRGWHRSLLVLTVEQEDCLQLEPMGCGSLEPTEVCLPAVDCWDGPCKQFIFLFLPFLAMASKPSNIGFKLLLNSSSFILRIPS